MWVSCGIYLHLFDGLPRERSVVGLTGKGALKSNTSRNELYCLRSQENAIFDTPDKNPRMNIISRFDTFFSNLFSCLLDLPIFIQIAQDVVLVHRPTAKLIFFIIFGVSGSRSLNRRNVLQCCEGEVYFV
jgi:hypothetical protein